MASARKPMASDSPSATTPRRIGSRSQRWRAIAESIDRVTCAIEPAGVRTATAQFPGLRIMTPSRTAWPPTVTLGLLAAGALRALGALEPALEALDPSTGVHELLLARIEGVALGADLDVQLRLGRMDLERVPARARHRREHVIGMDTGLHRLPRIAAASLATTLPPETTATVGPARSTFPARMAATAAAPAGSQASFARAYRKRMPSAISASLTRTLSTAPRQIWRASSPAKGGARPSAMVLVSTRTLWPASRPARKACACSGSTATIRARPARAVTMPDTRPPPPTPTTTVATSGTSSRISSASVPWPAMTYGSLWGWTNTRSVCASARSYATEGSGDDRSTVAP